MAHEIRTQSCFSGYRSSEPKMQITCISTTPVQKAPRRIRVICFASPSFAAAIAALPFAPSGARTSSPRASGMYIVGRL